MADFLQGQTFGSTEQITNTKLHNLVALASISNIKVSELSTGFMSSLPTTAGKIPANSMNAILAIQLSNDILTSLPSSAGYIPSQNKFLLGTCITDASLISVLNLSAIKLNYSTYGSLATFLNMRVGQEFRLLSQQASFPVILDAGAFTLSANWIPAKSGDNLTLIWDGSTFTEIGRVSV